MIQWDVPLEQSSTVTFTITNSRDNDGDSMKFGIALSTHDIEQFIGATEQSWAFNRYDGKSTYNDEVYDYANVDNSDVNADTVALHVDKEKGEVSVSVNGDHLGPMFQDERIKTEAIYPAMNTYLKGDQVELTSIELME